MKRKLQNITSKAYSVAAIVVLLFVWQILSSAGIVPSFLLPSPLEVVQAFVKDFPLLMDHFQGFYKAFYPIMVITQTIPTIAIAPLLVLWMGYEMAPKVTLIVIVTFFPIAIGLLEGFKSADKDTVNLLKAMGANRLQIFLHVKFPSSLGRFFASLRISVSYCVVGAVISEWLGGYNGLGVYMTRVRKSYAFDKMFAVIFLISAISLLLMWLVSILQKKCMPWEKRKGE